MSDKANTYQEAGSLEKKVMELQALPSCSHDQITSVMRLIAVELDRTNRHFRAGL